MKVPLLDLKAQYAAIRGEVDAAIARVVESQHFILGPEVEALEKEVAQYSQCAHAVGLSSGTDAILVGLMALGVGPGDEVVTSPHTFIATVSCIVRLGARPVFVDVDPASFNLDARLLERALTLRTKAIMPVHLFGQLADMEAITAISQRHRVPVIEDAAQAVGSEWRGRRAGAWGALGCLSFFPSKNLGAFGDAGAVVTNDAELARSVKLLRAQGQEPKYFSKILGGNFRIDAIQAAVLRAKLVHLDAWTAARQRNAARYRKWFAAAGFDVSQVKPTREHPLVLPPEPAHVRHIYNQFSIRSIERDALKQHLQELGIGTEIYYPQPMHLQECFASLGFKRGDFPEAEAAAAQSLAIPIYPELEEAQQRAVVEAIAAFHRRRR
ncbi:MAG: DegT/DnrJ/EryC1/StrS family aminotransferase [Myxococcales bacterium]|nr:DegT/DnrJ/EryC1/StrS family aminotransferase [Myxococcales bacterium]